jgi:hypothetical protein
MHGDILVKVLAASQRDTGEDQISSDCPYKNKRFASVNSYWATANVTFYCIIINFIVS